MDGRRPDGVLTTILIMIFPQIVLWLPVTMK